MLIFHEGLPGAGKTYEAVVKHVLPAIERGRKVITNIDGMGKPECVQAISDVLALPVETVQARLSYIGHDETKEVWKHVEINCLLVIDEVQNYWPVSKQKLQDEISEFITKHRHIGIDIICIGQDLRDTHNLWKRRIDRKVRFQKLDALGSVKRYRWVAYKSVGDMKFEKTTEGIESYSSRFYGTYDSHVADDVATNVYADKRAILWNSTTMRAVIAFVVIGAVVIPWYLYRQFRPETSSLIHHAETEVRDSEREIRSIERARVGNDSVSPKKQPDQGGNNSDQGRNNADQGNDKNPGREYIEVLATKYRARLTGVVISADRQDVVVEFRDDAMRVHDRLNAAALTHLGWSIRIYQTSFIEIQKSSRIIVVTAWPIESIGEISDKQNQEVADKPVEKKRT